MNHFLKDIVRVGGNNAVAVGLDTAPVRTVIALGLSKETRKRIYRELLKVVE